jgi:hypothetical protein
MKVAKGKQGIVGWEVVGKATDSSEPTPAAQQSGATSESTPKPKTTNRTSWRSKPQERRETSSERSGASGATEGGTQKKEPKGDLSLTAQIAIGLGLGAAVLVGGFFLLNKSPSQPSA